MARKIVVIDSTWTDSYIQMMMLLHHCKLSTADLSKEGGISFNEMPPYVDVTKEMPFEILRKAALPFFLTPRMSDGILPEHCGKLWDAPHLTERQKMLYAFETKTLCTPCLKGFLLEE